MERVVNSVDAAVSLLPDCTASIVWTNDETRSNPRKHTIPICEGREKAGIGHTWGVGGASQTVSCVCCEVQVR